jgi:hypothetical protein
MKLLPLLLLACTGSDPTDTGTPVDTGELDTGDPDTGDPDTGDPGPRPCTIDDLPTAMLTDLPCIGDNAEPIADFLFFDVNAPLWSDGATKRRWVYVPPDQKITVTDDHEWVFPAGSVFFKEFSLGERRVEMRVFVMNEAAIPKGYTYVFPDADSVDAEYLAMSGTMDVDGQEWTIPASDCAACHNKGPGDALGLETAQLVQGDQLQQFVDRGWLDALTGTLPALADPYGGGDPEPAARGWLHSNCAHCHPVNANLDLDWRTALADTNACGVDALNALGIEGLQRLAPGQPELSAIYVRSNDVDNYPMPALAKHLVDEPAMAVIADWITGIESCP